MQQHIEPVATKASYVISIGIGSGGFMTWLTENATALGVIFMAVGTLLGIGTFFINWYYQKERNEILKNK